MKILIKLRRGLIKEVCCETLATSQRMDVTVLDYDVEGDGSYTIRDKPVEIYDVDAVEDRDLIEEVENALIEGEG